MAELEELYNNYFKDVHLFIYSLFKDKHIAEDLTSGGVDAEKGYPDHAVSWVEVKPYIPN